MRYWSGGVASGWRFGGVEWWRLTGVTDVPVCEASEKLVFGF